MPDHSSPLDTVLSGAASGLPRVNRLTDATTSAVFILDALHPMSDEALRAAVDELTGALRELGPDVTAVPRLIATS